MVAAGKLGGMSRKTGKEVPPEEAFLISNCLDAGAIIDYCLSAQLEPNKHTRVIWRESDTQMLSYMAGNDSSHPNQFRLDRATRIAIRHLRVCLLNNTQPFLTLRSSRLYPQV
jgi:hypothetical protein